MVALTASPVSFETISKDFISKRRRWSSGSADGIATRISTGGGSFGNGRSGEFAPTPIQGRRGFCVSVGERLDEHRAERGDILAPLASPPQQQSRNDSRKSRKWNKRRIQEPYDKPTEHQERSEDGLSPERCRRKSIATEANGQRAASVPLMNVAESLQRVHLRKDRYPSDVEPVRGKRTDEASAQAVSDDGTKWPLAPDAGCQSLHNYPWWNRHPQLEPLSWSVRTSDLIAKTRIPRPRRRR